jgi:DNA-binding response OmpR family regulator
MTSVSPRPAPDIVVTTGYVLVVEDDPTARDVLCDALAAEGYEVVGAGDVEHALALVAERSPEVVVSDLDLGGEEGGVDLARRLRAAATTSELGLIAMSGSVEPDWPIVRPFDAYLRKPIDIDTLLHLVERLRAHVRRPATNAAE